MKEQLFYQTYLSLETELLSMTDTIFFTDDHLQVYSIDLSSFLLKCNAEIESIIHQICEKEVYKIDVDEKKKEIGKKLEIANKFDLLKEKLKTKSIYINNHKFYFEKKYSEEFAPLDFQTPDGESFGKVYLGLKHNRIANYKKATLEVAINTLGYLYILNLYYGFDEYPDLYTKPNEQKVTPIFNSQVFQPMSSGIVLSTYLTISRNPEGCELIQNRFDNSICVTNLNLDKCFIEIKDDELTKLQLKSSITKLRDAISNIEDFSKIIENSDDTSEIYMLEGFYDVNSHSLEHMSVFHLLTNREVKLNTGYTKQNLEEELNKFLNKLN